MERRINTMKKILAGFLTLMMTMSLLSGCGSAPADATQEDTTTQETTQEAGATEETADDGKLQIVTTIFPAYDWVKTILGENAANVDLTMLLDNGVDLHSYQPTADDIVKISNCDMFVYVGGESDAWVEEVLGEAKNADMQVINLLEVLGDKVKEEEIVEGMEHEHEHEGEEAHEEEHAHEGEEAHEEEHAHEGEEAHEHEHAQEAEKQQEHSHDHDEEITEDDIKPREVSEFAGEWQSLYPVLMTGALDEYVEFQAEKKEISVEESREEIEMKWNCGVKTIKIEDNSITLFFDDGSQKSGTYEYAGFATKTNEEGKISSIRHEFLKKDGDGPKYVMLNDHGHEPVDHVEHFHIYFGDNNFDELVTTKSNPFFVDAKLDAKGCLENVMGHEKGHDHNHEHEHEHEMDEHVWLSLKNAMVLCDALTEAVKTIDADNAQTYQENADAYKAELTALDEAYAKAVEGAKKKTVLFGDRFPFRYLTDDYGLTYFAAFSGCSAETEASYETVVFLADKTDEEGLSAILTIEGENHKIAETIRENTKTKEQEILTMNSMQTTTSADVEAGASYLTIMTDNLEVLQTALQ